MKILNDSYRLLFTVITSVIILLIITASFMIGRYFNYLENQRSEYNLKLLAQISTKLDNIYSLNKIFLNNLEKNITIKECINSPKFYSRVEELSFLVKHKIDKTSISNNPFSNEFKANPIQDICIIDSIKPSLLTHDDNTIYYLTSDFYINYDRLVLDPLYISLKRDKQQNIIFGKLQDGIINGLSTNSKLAVIAPFRRNNNDFQKFILIILNNDFIKEICSNIENMNQNELFILDNCNNLITAENKDSLEKDKLIFSKIKSFLNTSVSKNKDNPSSEKRIFYDKEYIANYNNNDYLVVSTYAENTGCKLFYYQALDQIHPSIIQIILFIIIVISLIICIFFAVILFRKKI